jgi:hypothetical protein
VEWDEAGLSEFGEPNEEHPALEIDVGTLERHRFARTKPGGGEQADQRRKGVGPQTFRGRQSRGFGYQLGDFLIGKDVRLRPAPLASKDPCRWDLRARVMRVQPGCESSHLTQAPSPRRALHVDRRHGPPQRQVGSDERPALVLHELDKVTERDSRFAQLRT